MVRKDHYDQIDNSNNQYAKLKILFPTHDFDFVFTPLQFTMPSGLHSVLERPFSEANGRPFLVKRSPLIVC